VSLVEVRNGEVQVELLWMGAVGPSWGGKVRHALEREYEPGFGVQGREAIAHRPPGVGPIDHAAKERLVEPGEAGCVGAVKNHALERAYHRAPG
jgi:hypothetical protein